VSAASPNKILFPGSPKCELKKQLPGMLDALELMHRKLPASSATMVLPNPELKALADKLSAPPPNVEIQVGDLPQALAQTDVAIASTGTVTMECAFFGVPAVTLYKTSWSTYQIARRLVTVKSLTMPNLLAGEEVYPEFLQNAATPENIAGAALQLLQNESRRQKIEAQLAGIIGSLGGPGACERAARAILGMFH
jgi:lipid-A-disaccharide synthase